MVSEEEFEQANRRGAEAARKWPLAKRARYDRNRRRLVIKLDNELEIVIPPHLVQGLETATPDQLDSIEINPAGMSLYFPKLDADLYLPGLFEGHFGSERWEARRLGALGGAIKSPAKAAAARKNGKTGGRPRKPLVDKPTHPPISA